MSLTISPSAEACQALVEQINSGEEVDPSRQSFTLERYAKYSRIEIDPLEEIDGLQIDVVAVEETQLNETLEIEDRTSHKIAIWIRRKLDDIEPETLDPMALLVRQIYQRVNNFTSSDRRVNVWETDEETRMNPDKAILNQMRLFVATIVLRVEVDAS